MFNIYPEHEKRLPFVRIKSVSLENFKNVESGKLELNCAKEYTPYNTKSDILGLYGQNGSGKTTLIQAISTIRELLCGEELFPAYASYIDVASEYAKLGIEFDFQYPEDDTVATVIYEVRLEAKEVTVSNKEENTTPKKERKVFISNEMIRTNLYDDGSLGRMHAIIDTENNPVCVKSLEQYYFDRSDAKQKEDLTYYKRKAYDDSRSFIFNDSTAEIFNTRNTETDHTKYFEILAELNFYAEKFLCLIGTRTSGMVQLKTGIPIYLPGLRLPLVFKDSIAYSVEMYEKWIKPWLESINVVIGSIIPGLSISASTTPTVSDEGEDGVYIRLMSERGDRRFPFINESDGVIKIFSVMACFIYIYNQGSATLVIDEFDSGVFEYMLGELLKVFEESGKGQLIFTSHNLRPLEVLDKKFIRFTTTDPRDRYTRLKNVNATNNLRDLYLREIMFGNCDVKIYNKTNRFKIKESLRAAGKAMEQYGKE